MIGPIVDKILPMGKAVTHEDFDDGNGNSEEENTAVFTQHRANFLNPLLPGGRAQISKTRTKGDAR